MSDVSVIGMGAMGRALAATLLEKGFAVTVWNRTADKTGPLVQAGAVAAGTAGEALAASPVTITCITSHEQTIELLESDRDRLAGKCLIELSTGGAREAEHIAELLAGAGGHWLIGIIQGYPTGIGTPEMVITAVGESPVWEQHEALLKTLAGSAAHVGTEPGMLAALFAGLFTARTAFMFGMVYGALVCERAGIPMEVFAEQLPVTMGVLPSYYRYFADTVPMRRFDDPPASMFTYMAALDDALKTFEENGAPDQLPRLFRDISRAGVEAGHGDQALTAVVPLILKGDIPA